MFDVFLSHSSKDKDQVRNLVHRLRNEGVSVWFDEEQIEHGDNFVRKIEHGLSASRYILLALSNASVKSNWVGVEYQSTFVIEIEQSSTRVIPVLLEPIKRDEMPRLLLSKRCVDLSKVNEFRRLVGRVKRPPIAEYCDRERQKPIISGLLFTGDYHVQPADLLRVVLREVDFRSGDPIRGTRTHESLTLADFVGEMTEAAETGQMYAAVFFGEAGVGKTTTCRWLCRLLVEQWSSQRLLPIYVPLGNVDTDGDFHAMLDQQIEGETFNELAQDVQFEGGKLVFFLDGLNELAPSALERVLALSQQEARRQNASIVLTSRPVAAVHTIWQGREARFFEIQRWTERQLEEYFKKNERSDILLRIPSEVRHCLRLPLLAFLIIRRLDRDEPLPSLRTVADVFAYVVDRFLGTHEEVRKSRAITDSREELGSKYKVYLQELAYYMTRQKVVQTNGESLELVLSRDEKALFKPFLAHLVNSGLLRCSNTIVGLDPQASLDELRSLRIGFLHQAFQEYLTARQLLSTCALQLPADVSHDAFWREVPIYMIQSIASAGQQEKFARKFLTEKRDYLTTARLAGEITDPGSCKVIRSEVVMQLRVNISKQRLYPYAIEAFAALGQMGRDALRNSLRNPTALTSVYAKFEAHLIGSPVKSADEVVWRTLGRSVYLLGELSDFWLAEYLLQYLSHIRSLHLLYHIGEALLALIRKSDFQGKEHEKIRAAAQALLGLHIGDPVTQAYALACLRECDGDQEHQEVVAVELRSFLSARACAERTHFNDEFWQRAHGAEAFAEVANPGKCVEVLSYLLAVEDRADYSGHEEVGYRLVQSSLLKAALRSCDLSNGQSANWRSFLESVFVSKRVAENGWACRHLERLLLTWFRTPEDLAWIKRWKASHSIGGQRIRGVLANVIWLSD